MQFPCIHLNGSSADSLRQQYGVAETAVSDALAKMRAIDVNGRDYYVISSEAASVAMREHRERLAKMESVLSDLNAILGSVIEQQKEQRRTRVRQDSPRVVVRDEHGAELCRCTLAEFERDNEDLDDGEIGALRTRIAKGEEWHCGGGAAAFFTVSRAEG